MVRLMRHRGQIEAPPTAAPILGSFCGLEDTTSDPVKRGNYSLVSGSHPDQRQEHRPDFPNSGAPVLHPRSAHFFSVAKMQRELANLGLIVLLFLAAAGLMALW
jgi:hypothetical protein